MSDLIAVYNNGGIEQIGTSRELYETPQTRFVADFIGESVLLPCTAVAGGCEGSGWFGDTPQRAEFQGGRGVLVLRPEDLSLERLTEESPAAPTGTAGESRKNSIEGVVTDVIYVGAALISLVRTDSGTEIEVRTPRSEASLAVRGGDRVVVRWHPDRAVIVPDEAHRARGDDRALATQAILAQGR